LYQQQPFQTGVQSQYQGYKPAYQPVGFVQSQYQRPAPSIQQPGTTGTVNPASYQTSNYRGNQPGHDQYLRSDSTNPSQFGFAQPQTQYQTQPQYGQQPVQQGSYFAPNYRGNQPGHDQYLRSDSANPSQFGFAQPQPQYQTQPQYGQQPIQQGSYFTSNYRGNQPGHDQNLRSDSTQPTQYGFR